MEEKVKRTDIDFHCSAWSIKNVRSIAEGKQITQMKRRKVLRDWWKRRKYRTLLMLCKTKFLYTTGWPGMNWTYFSEFGGPWIRR